MQREVETYMEQKADKLLSSLVGMGNARVQVAASINFDKVDEILGMDIIICTTANTDAEAKALLKLFNMPFTS